LQAAILIRSGRTELADAFCTARLGETIGHAFGTLPADMPLQPLIERAFA
jgi:putative acyl-CoA dehydrogenase